MTRQLQNLFVLASMITAFAAASASAQLVNPGFDNAAPGPGPVGNFGLVVGPPFSPGFWGAELSTITATGGGPGGPVTPNSNPYMLEMSASGDTVTEAWQVINVAGSLPPNPTVSFTALFNASATAPGVNAAVRIFTFATGANWPTASLTLTQPGVLDASAQTWQPITLAPTPIPANTDWILAEVYYDNSTLGLSGGTGYVDDARVTIGSVPEPSSLALGGLALAGAVWMRRRLRQR